MDTKDFREVLHEALAMYMEDDSAFKHVTTFREAGVLSTNEGLVVKTTDGSEFHLTIVQSR